MGRITTRHGSKAAPALNLGELIDRASMVREEKRCLEAQVKDKARQLEAAEAQIIDALDKEGVRSSTGKLATASMSESVVPQVESWDSFYAFIAKHKYFHLLDRRPSVTGCRELFETKGKIPGVLPFVKRKLNLTNVRT
ncbi:MAG: hypothetical protein ACXWIS_14570 [Burkholderiales bacterium]